MIKVARYAGIKVTQSNNTLMISGTSLSINAKWAASQFAKKYGYELDTELAKREYPTLHFVVGIKPKVTYTDGNILVTGLDANGTQSIQSILELALEYTRENQLILDSIDPEQIVYLHLITSDGHIPAYLIPAKPITWIRPEPTAHSPLGMPDAW